MFVFFCKCDTIFKREIYPVAQAIVFPSSNVPVDVKQTGRISAEKVMGDDNLNKERSFARVFPLYDGWFCRKLTLETRVGVSVAAC